MAVHDKLKESRVKHALAKHRATIIASLYETYNKLESNLKEGYYRQDIDLDASVFELSDEDIQTQIQYYQQEYYRCKEVELNFLSSKTLMDSIDNLRRGL